MRHLCITQYYMAWATELTSLSRLMNLPHWVIQLKLLGRWCGCGNETCTLCQRRCILSLVDGDSMWMPCEGTDGQLYDLKELLRYATFKGIPFPSPVDPNTDLSQVRLWIRKWPTLRSWVTWCTPPTPDSTEKGSAPSLRHFPTSTLSHALPRAVVYNAPSAAIWMTTHSYSV